MMYLKARVQLGDGRPYTGYIEEERYKQYGSVYPYFPLPEALKIQGELNSISDGHLKMDYMDGAFIVCDFAAQEIYRIPVRTMETNEGLMRLHEIGTGDWDWRLVDMVPVTTQTRLPVEDRKSRLKLFLKRRL